MFGNQTVFLMWQLAILGLISNPSMEEKLVTKGKVADFCNVISWNRLIRNLTVQCDAYGVDVSLLSPFIESNNNLRELSLHGICFDCDCDDDDEEDGRCGCTTQDENLYNMCSLTLALSRRHNKSSLKSIDLYDNSFVGCAEELVAELIGALDGYHNLGELNLMSNNVGRSGCTALGNLLKQPTCKLEEMNLDSCGIDNEGLTILANGLVGNNTLKRIILNENTSINVEGWEALSTVLCDMSTVETTYLSNHTLEDIGIHANPGRKVASLLYMNRNQSKSAVAREKILRYYLYTNVDLQLFLDMELEVLPYVIDWIGRDNYGSTLMYQLFKRYPLCLNPIRRLARIP